MKIKYKYYNYEYEREYIGENLKTLSKLIIEFLNKKDNFEIEELNKIINSFYEITLEEKDYLGYINAKQNIQYEKIIEIPTNIVTVDLQSEGHGRDFSWWTENYQRMICAATTEFKSEKEEYTLEEIEQLIESKIIYPIYPFGRKTDKKAFYKKDNIKYLLNYKSKEMTEDSEYFKYMVKKELETIGYEEFIKQIKVFIINMKLNLDNYDDYYYEYNDEYDNEYDDEKESTISENERVEDIQNELVKAYNSNIDNDKIKNTSIEIVMDYLRKLKDMEFWFEDINIEQVINTVSKLKYPENKELCEEIEQIAIDLNYAELCYELAAYCDWVDKQIMAEIVINDGNPEINYYFASEVEGADIERHKQVILNNEYTEEYILERTKKL